MKTIVRIIDTLLLGFATAAVELANATRDHHDMVMMIVAVRLLKRWTDYREKKEGNHASQD